jgi:hypothetical protein
MNLDEFYNFYTMNLNLPWSLRVETHAVSSLGMFFFSFFSFFSSITDFIIGHMCMYYTTVAEARRRGKESKKVSRARVQDADAFQPLLGMFFMFFILFFAVLRLTKVAASTNMAPLTAPELE